jgi:hypothetical protein
MGPGFTVSSYVPPVFTGFTTPATMNGSTTVTNMRSVTINSSGLFVAVGYTRANNYPVSAYG